MEKSFEVTGSKGNLYTVVFDNSSGSLKAFCNCRAGMYGQLCKHVINLLNTDSDVHNALLQDSRLCQIIAEYEESVRICDEAKKNMSDKKHQLARVLLEE